MLDIRFYAEGIVVVVSFFLNTFLGILMTDVDRVAVTSHLAFPFAPCQHAPRWYSVCVYSGEVEGIGCVFNLSDTLKTNVFIAVFYCEYSEHNSQLWTVEVAVLKILLHIVFCIYTN